MDPADNWELHDSAELQGSAYLRIQGVSKSYGTETDRMKLALCDISLDVAEGEFLAVVGPSGCGKSTFLQIVAGLIAPSESMVYLFQQYTKSLFPWRTVIDNVAFAVEHKAGMSRDMSGFESVLGDAKAFSQATSFIIRCRYLFQSCARCSMTTSEARFRPA